MNYFRTFLNFWDNHNIQAKQRTTDNSSDWQKQLFWRLTPECLMSSFDKWQLSMFSDTQSFKLYHTYMVCIYAQNSAQIFTKPLVQIRKNVKFNPNISLHKVKRLSSYCNPKKCCRRFIWKYYFLHLTMHFIFWF